MGYNFSMKSFIIVGILLLLIALGAVGYVWMKLQDVSKEIKSEITESVLDENSVRTVPDTVEQEVRAVGETLPPESVQIDTSQITSDQKAVAKKFGIDVDDIVVTPEMISCAEEKIGVARLQEIIDGSSPTTLEGISMLGCL